MAGLDLQVGFNLMLSWALGFDPCLGVRDVLCLPTPPQPHKLIQSIFGINPTSPGLDISHVTYTMKMLVP